MQNLRLPIFALACAALAFAVVAYTQRGALAPAGLACPPGAEPMSRLELLFGAGRKDGSEVADADWRAFLDAEVTPRFPDGLTVLTGYGQWRNSTGVIAKETSRVLVIWHKRDTGAQARIEAVRAAYKAQFGQESVMRVDSLSCVSF